jgi:hypothetical protein
MAKARVDSTEGRVALYDQMIEQDKLCEELITYLPENARQKFRHFKTMRPAQWWTKPYLEDLRTLAMAAHLVEFYQDKEAESSKKGEVKDACDYNKLLRSNMIIVSQYMGMLQLKPSQAVSPDIREAAAKLRVEDELRGLQDGGDLGLYAH